MGGLEDAIREHLDLKRRHGASDEEVRRQEAEALGPARRETGPDEDMAEAAVAVPGEGDLEVAELDAEAPATEAESAEPAAESREAQEARATDAGFFDHEAPLPPADPVDDEPPHGDDLGEEALHTHPTEVAPPQERPEEEAPPPMEPEAAEPAIEADSVEHDQAAEPTEEDAGREEPQAEDDVLEETPDFLQETPEHDRLWFEQKPPRDFDFD